jgi:hypothetical protein
MKKVIELCLKVEEQRICSLIEENETESEKRSNSRAIVVSLRMRTVFSEKGFSMEFEFSRENEGERKLVHAKGLLWCERGLQGVI